MKNAPIVKDKTLMYNDKNYDWLTCKTAIVIDKYWITDLLKHDNIINTVRQ